MNEQQPKIFTFKLPGVVVDQIVAALMERPMKEVLQAFGMIQTQLKEQLEPASAPKQEDKPSDGV